MHQKRKKEILMTTWRMALSTKRAIFCSFLNVTFLEKNVICTFCLAKCIRKGANKLFLSERHISRKERHLYFLPCKMHQNRTTIIVPFDYMKNGSLHKKSNFFCSFLNVIFLEKNVICTFCLAKCIRKGQTNPFDYMKNGSLHKKSNFLFLSERHFSRKERHL